MKQVVAAMCNPKTQTQQDGIERLGNLHQIPARQLHQQREISFVNLPLSTAKAILSSCFMDRDLDGKNPTFVSEMR